jgi:hypothetical protein
MDRIFKATSGRTRLLFSGELTAPGAGEYAVLLDTTRGPLAKTSTAPPKYAALPTVGTNTRGSALGRIYPMLVQCTGQNVTLLECGLDPDGTWTQFASTTLTAGADAQSITWDPSFYGYTDVLIVALAGGIPPTKIYAQLLERTVP